MRGSDRTLVINPSFLEPAPDDRRPARDRMSLNINRLHKLLRLASHSESVPIEAHNAAVLARNILLAENLDIDCISVSPVAAGPADVRAELDGARAQLRASQERCQASVRECERLRKECDELRANNARLEKDREEFAIRMSELFEQALALEQRFDELYRSYHQFENGGKYVSFDDFADIAASRTGRKSWKAAVALALDLPIRELNAWSTVGLIPAEYMQRIETLDDTAFAPASRKAWTEQQIDEFEVVLEATNTDFEAALALTNFWQRPVYETTVTRQRRRLQREGGRAPSSFSRSSPSRL